jgi:hypothetical protein
MSRWCSLSAWPQNVQTGGVAAPVIIAAFCLGVGGAVNENTISLFLLSLPAVLTRDLAWNEVVQA